MQPHHTRSWNAKLFRFMVISPWPRLKQTQVQMFRSESESGNLEMLSRRPERHKKLKTSQWLSTKDNALDLVPQRSADLQHAYRSSCPFTALIERRVCGCRHRCVWTNILMFTMVRWVLSGDSQHTYALHSHDVHLAQVERTTLRTYLCIVS
jgi:hypothetical protein